MNGNGFRPTAKLLVTALCIAGLVVTGSGCGGGGGGTSGGGTGPVNPGGRKVMGYVTYVGAAVSGATVQVVGVAGSYTTGSSGYFELTGVPSGSQVLAVSAPGLGNLQRIIIVPDNADPVFYVSLSGGGGGGDGGPPPPPF